MDEALLRAVIAGDHARLAHYDAGADAAMDRHGLLHYAACRDDADLARMLLAGGTEDQTCAAE